MILYTIYDGQGNDLLPITNHDPRSRESALEALRHLPIKAARLVAFVIKSVDG